jgi:hypothetical protein
MSQDGHSSDADDSSERISAEADDLDLVEAVLLRMGQDIPDPTRPQSHATFYSSLIAIRARSLYQNFLHSLTSPAAIAPLLAIRPLVESAILSKWVSLNPALHGELWFAQSEDRELTAIREQEKHLGIRVRADVPTDTIIESVEEKAAWRDEAVAKAKAAGKKYDRPMPGLDRLVQEIEAQEPGHKIAVRQQYDLIYRAFSPWMHTEAASFKATAMVTDDGLTFLGDISPYDVEQVRVMAAGLFAYVLEVLGMAKGDNSAVAARVVRDYLMIVRKPSRE